MKYYVTYRIEGRYTAEVEASSIEMAQKEAVTTYETADFGEVEDRIQREIQKLQCYADSHHVRTHKSKFTGCRYCGSKVNNEYVNEDNVCPCCGNSLYSDTDRATINRYKGNINRWQQELEEMQRTNKRKKSGTMWYVSTLYH